jgi:uncharacterized protein YjbJ (UPF0337 family)
MVDKDRVAGTTEKVLGKAEEIAGQLTGDEGRKRRGWLARQAEMHKDPMVRLKIPLVA